MRKILIAMGTVLLLAAGCMPGGPEGNVIIEGHFPSFAGKEVVVNIMEVYETSPQDTISVSSKGIFKAGLTIERPELYLLKFDNRNHIALLVQPGEKLSLAADGEIRGGNYSVAGSPGTEKIREMEEYLDLKRREVDSVRQIYSGVMHSGQFTHPEVTDHYEKIKEIVKGHLEDMIREDPGSLTSIIALNKRFGKQKLFNEKEDILLYRLVDSALLSIDPKSIHAIAHHEKTLKANQMLAAEEHARQRLAKGKPAPDFEMESYRGNLVSLSDLKGKPVILYFWSSAKKNSRQVNKSVKEIYMDFKAKGLEILAVSLDSYEDMWRNAIREDNLPWINVTDLQSAFSAPVFLYQVPSDLPYFYIIDEHQKIFWRGEDLSELKKNLLMLTGK